MEDFHQEITKLQMAVCLIPCLEVEKQIQKNKVTHGPSSKVIVGLDIET